MSNPKNNYRTPTQSLRLFFTGIAMGTADVIPGVSGGTMAFILGIYEDLLNAIKSFNLEVARLALQFNYREVLEQIPWRFLLILLSGIGLAFFSLAHVVGWMQNNYPEFLFAFFFGLILASILAVGAMVRWLPRAVIAFIVGTIMAYLIVGLIPLDISHDPLTLFFSGMIAIMAMILPGISGSFILLILGQYDFVIEAVRSFDIVSILFVGAGSIVGIVGFSRVLSWLLRHYHQATVATLVGFMLGSLREIWPWKEVIATRINRHGETVPLIERNILPNFASQEFVIALMLCILGFLIVTVLDHLQSGSNPVFRIFGQGRRQPDAAPAD